MSLILKIGVAYRPYIGRCRDDGCEQTLWHWQLILQMFQWALQGPAEGGSDGCWLSRWAQSYWFYQGNELRVVSPNKQQSRKFIQRWEAPEETSSGVYSLDPNVSKVLFWWWMVYLDNFQEHLVRCLSWQRWQGLFKSQSLARWECALSAPFIIFDPTDPLLWIGCTDWGSVQHCSTDRQLWAWNVVWDQWMNEWMNEQGIYIVLYCVLLYTQSALGITTPVVLTGVSCFPLSVCPFMCIYSPDFSVVLCCSLFMLCLCICLCTFLNYLVFVLVLFSLLIKLTACETALSCLLWI